MIVELLVYSCIETHQVADDSFILSCRWNSRGFYSSEKRCADDGAAEIGKPVHEFVMLPGGPRTVRRYRCPAVPMK